MNISKNGRPASATGEPNKALPYLIKIYEVFNNDVDKILSTLNVSYMTFYRWNNGYSQPRIKRHLQELAKYSDFTIDEIKLQHLKLEMNKRA